MAGKKKPVHVEPSAVTKVFDKKFTKAVVGKCMKDAAVKVVNKSSKLTATVTDKKAEGFLVLLSLKHLKKEGSGSSMTVEASVGIQGATWPKKSMFAFASGETKTTVPDPKKIDGDAKFVIESAVTTLMKNKVVKALEARA